MRNLNTMSSFIHFPLPLSIPLGTRTLHTTTIQMHKSRSSIIRRRSRFNFNRWCVFLSSVMNTSRMQTGSYIKRPRSICCCRTFYNSSWGPTEVGNKIAQEHYGRKMTMFLGRTTKLYNPKNLYIWSAHYARSARGWGLFDHQKQTVVQGYFCWFFSLFVTFCYFFYCS